MRAAEAAQYFRRCPMKRLAALALMCALIISLLTGCTSVRQNDLPEAEISGGEYGLRAAVLYDGGADSRIWEDTLSRARAAPAAGL